MSARAAEPMSLTLSNACAATSPRPALSNERLSVNDRRQVVYRLKHPLRTEAESEADPASLADIPQLPTTASSREGRLFLPYRRYSDRIATPPYSLGGFRYTGGPDHFRHRIAQLRPRRPREAYLRLRTLAGEQAQV